LFFSNNAIIYSLENSVRQEWDLTPHSRRPITVRKHKHGRVRALDSQK